MYNRYESALAQRQSESQLRAPRTYNPIDATHVVYKGSTYLMMASNNYLGLTHHPHVQERARQAILDYGTGSGGENIYSGKFTGINHLAWCEICYIVEMLNANNGNLADFCIGLF